MILKNIGFCKAIEAPEAQAFFVWVFLFLNFKNVEKLGRL